MLQQPRPALTPEQALLVLSEIKKRADARSVSMVDENFPKQAAFINATARKIAVKCPRRAGKTEGVARRLIKRCLQQDGVAVLYVGLTRDSCRRIFWEGSLKPLIARMHLPGKSNETRLTHRFTNNSRIYCLGMDVKPEEMKKLLGGKYAEVIIDEAGSFRIDLRKMVYEILGPAVSDYLGTICMTGTPEDLTSGLYYEATRDDDVPRLSDWEVHEWDTHDNPYMRRQWEIEIAALIAANPRIVETPMYERMYLGKWRIDKSRLVYKYDRARNWIPQLPPGEYIYGLGVDLGFDDDTSFVLSAYNGASRRLYLMRPYKRPEMLTDDIAERIRYYQRSFEIFSLVIDGANKQVVEDMRKRFQLPFIAADKSGKAEFIEIFNSELIMGNIVLVGDDVGILETEWLNLIWDDKNPQKREEHPACDNHLADAALYIWRKQYQYLYQPKQIKPVVTEEQKIEKWAEQESEFLRLNSGKAFFEREF